MSSNDNYNRNRHRRTDENGQRESEVHGGELRSGRLSQIKNDHPESAQVPNQYIDGADELDPEGEER